MQQEKEAAEEARVAVLQKEKDKIRAKKERKLREVMDIHDKQYASKKILSLEKEGSLEDIMLLMDKTHGGRLISPRARSASNPALGRRDRSGDPRSVKFDA